MPALTTLVNFNGTNEANPDGSLIFDANGDLFGTTSAGGTGFGAVFEIVKTAFGYASSPTVLANFNSGTGATPQGGLIADANGDLFGTTSAGGANNQGTVFEIVKNGGGYSSTPITLVNFNSANGSAPKGGLIADSAGNLFGTASAGGSSNQGIIFEIQNTASGYPSTPITLATFNGGNGSAPLGGLIADANGDLFGTTSTGGSNNLGTVFEVVKSAGGYISGATTLVTFTGANGGTPLGGLTADANGDLFGTTSAGGTANLGTVFEIAKTAGGYSSNPITLASFNSGNGSTPKGGLIADANGDLFGTTSAGGPTNLGTVFEIVKAFGSYSSTPIILATFNNASGAVPLDSLIADAAGTLFATTSSIANGSVVEITSSGYALSAPAASAAVLNLWLTGQLSSPAAISDSAAMIQANLDGLQTVAANGLLSSVALTDTGIPTIAVTSAQLTGDAGVLNDITAPFALSVSISATNAVVAGLAGHATTVSFSGNAGQYVVTPAGDGASLALSNSGIVYHLSNVTALQFSDFTDFVASQTPAIAGAVSSAQIADLYSAVLARRPDAPGLAYYENLAATTPALPITVYAQDFLTSPEYTAAHNYPQTATGDGQFITDTYNNLLHRGPETGAVAWYQANVINPLLAGLPPGSTAYGNAELLAHAAVLADFSQSGEFLGNVQVTAQNPSSAQHWLILI